VAIDAAELIAVRLPLVRPFVTATTTTAAREVLLVRVVVEGVEGWGECSAEQEAAYWHETVHTARAVLPAIAAGRPAPHHPMAEAAFEMAVLDATLRAEHRSLAGYLGATRSHVDATATVGFDDDIDAFVAAGYRSVKVKVAPEHPLPAGVHHAAAAAVGVQVDANGSYASVPERVADLDGLGLVCIEQPLAAEDLAGHARLCRELRTTVCLDESVASLASLDAVLAARAAGAVSVKPARLGGIVAARRAHDRCVDAGIPAKVGGLLETGIGRAAALAVAALPGFSLPADLSASDRYWVDDLTEPFVLDGAGRLAVPDGPGLGVTVRTEVIEQAALWRQDITP